MNSSGPVYPRPGDVPAGSDEVFTRFTGAEGWVIYSAVEGERASLWCYYSADTGAAWTKAEIRLNPDLNQLLTKDNIFVSMVEEDGRKKVWLLVTSILQPIELPPGSKYGNVSPPQLGGTDHRQGSLSMEFADGQTTERYEYKTADAGDHWIK
ncbi:hypothetical protein ['Paenibacillus yunnanensis' Narsing Rao et al. 2020]|uniref:hypothetical protein n=1 Tax=Paenibacillus tengchongensis TaxID=2608684 RepID=UPI001652A9A3|nr:hypothetical protein [Paenibacillus tengchongensis]